MEKDLEGKLCEEQLTSLGLFSLENEAERRHCGFHHLHKGREGTNTDLFSVLTSDRT